MSDHYPDSTGHPIRVTYFLKYDGPNKLGGRTRFRGQVTELSVDNTGPYFKVSEWRDGKFTGRERLGRPEWAEVMRKPPNLKDMETEAKQRDVRTEALAMERARAKARKKKGSSRRAVRPKRKS